MHLVNYADEVLEHYGVCRAVAQAPRVPIVGASMASMFNERLLEHLPVLGDIAALHATDTYSKYSISIPVRSGNPQEVWDAFCGGSIGVFEQPNGIRMDVAGEWKNETRADLCSGRRIKLRFRARARGARFLDVGMAFRAEFIIAR